MLRWPEKAQVAIRRLFRTLQPIDVFVEDKDDEVFYRKLLNFATENKITIHRVFGLGGRQKVIDAASAYDWSVRPALFIIDGDLPWIRGERCPKIKGLHQHSCYCVENLLLCELAIAKIISEELVLDEVEVVKRLDYNSWKNDLAMPLLELFAAYATVNLHDSSVPTVSNGVGVLCVQKNKTTALCPVKSASAAAAALSAASAKVGSSATQKTYKQIRKRVDAIGDPFNVPSGKDCLLPLLNFRIQAVGCRLKKESLRYRLAASGRRERFKGLRIALEAAV